MKETIRDRYVSIMSPVFFPDNPIKPDIIQLFASLLRIVGMEDKGWDPYVESLSVLDDLNSLMQLELPPDQFVDSELTKWRLGLLLYNHIVEMSAPYEVLTNLLRYRLSKGYSPNPYDEFLITSGRKRSKNRTLFPAQKIEIIKQLSSKTGLQMGDIFDEFHNSDFRNAIAHSDFVVTENSFRCRNGVSRGAFQLSLEKVNELITKSAIFINTFFELEKQARRFWGEHAYRSIPYDPKLKGIIEVLVNKDGLMNGFTVHWPNGSESTYQRTENRVDMTNCMLEIQNSTVLLMVGTYAQRPSHFSPLVEAGHAPAYTPLKNGSETVWKLN